MYNINQSLAISSHSGSHESIILQSRRLTHTPLSSPVVMPSERASSMVGMRGHVSASS